MIDGRRYNMFSYSSIISSIILTLSLKLFWNNRHSAMVWNFLTQSVYRENNAFCSSVIVAWSFSSFQRII